VRIEMSDEARALRRVPDREIGCDDDAVRTGRSSRRWDVGDLARRRVEAADETVVLIRVPDDAVGANGRIVGKGLVARELILGDRRCGGDRDAREGQSSGSDEKAGDHRGPPDEARLGLYDNVDLHFRGGPRAGSTHTGVPTTRKHERRFR
jgi:hypothetical protein